MHGVRELIGRRGEGGPAVRYRLERLLQQVQAGGEAVRLPAARARRLRAGAARSTLRSTGRSGSASMSCAFPFLASTDLAPVRGAASKQSRDRLQAFIDPDLLRCMHAPALPRSFLATVEKAGTSCDPAVWGPRRWRFRSSFCHRLPVHP